MTRTLTITLPLPPRELHPNARCHYMAKAKKTKQYRNDAALAAVAAKREAKMVYPMPAAIVQATFITKTKRHMDPDNALASLKSAIDGLTDARVLHSDRDVTHLPIKFEQERTNPRVVLRIMEN